MNLQPDIIVFEGGGTRGIMHCTVLNDLLSPRPKLVSGTSVGSMIAGAYAAGVSAAELTRFFTVSAPKIFSGAWWIPVPRLWSSAKYSPANLRAALIELVGDKTLADCSIPFLATAFDMRTGRPAYFQSYPLSDEDKALTDQIVIGPESDMKLVDVMLASSAAQSYFPGHSWGGYLFWDGGSTGNNAPDMLALAEWDEIGQGRPMMLSLGNGRTPWPYKGQDMTNPGIATVAAATFNIAYSGPENTSVWLARRELGPNHIRIDPEIPDFEIDDARPETLAAMQMAAHMAVKQLTLENTHLL